MGTAKLAAFILGATLTIIGLLQVSIGKTSQISKEKEEEKQKENILRTVEAYVEFSGTGKLEELSNLTTTVPKFACKETKTTERLSEHPEKKLPRGTLIVTSSPESLLALRLDWIRKEFSKSILDNKKKIVMIGDVTLKDNLAKVSVNLGDDQQYALLPWVFMLTKEDRDGSWKIYDINTPAYADDYYP